MCLLWLGANQVDQTKKNEKRKQESGGHKTIKG
jgi:hypothetical protein